jgi:hypothetical protein
MGSFRIFIDLIFPALVSSRPLTEMKRKGIFLRSRGGGLCVRLTTLPPSVADCLKILGALNSEALEACLRLYRDSFTFLTNYKQPNCYLCFMPRSNFKYIYYELLFDKIYIRHFQLVIQRALSANLRSLNVNSSKYLHAELQQ